MRIDVVREEFPITHREELLDLVLQQLHFIGYGHTLEEAQAVMLQALRPGSPAVLFVGIGEG